MLDRSRLVRRSQPSEALSLLLQAGLAPEKQALQAWRRWTAIRSFESPSPTEKKLIATFAGRIGELDPASPLRPRIDGLAKQQWTVAQVGLGLAVNGLQCLAAAGIPFLLLKGTALQAERLGPPLPGEVAILVQDHTLPRAVAALGGAGWAAAKERTTSRRRWLLERGFGLAYRQGRHGRIDLHVTAFRGACAGRAEADAAVWTGAREATLGSLPVLIPQPVDGILGDLTGAAPNTVDWAARVHARIARQPVDWDRLTDAAGRHGLALPCLGGLGYLREGLAAPVPDSVLSFLRTAPVPGAAWLGYLANEHEFWDRRPLPKAIGYAASRLLHRWHRRGREVDRVAS
jgi:hypothetical protein